MVHAFRLLHCFYAWRAPRRLAEDLTRRRRMERWFATWLRTKRKHAHAVATARSMIARMPKVRLFWALGEWKFQTMIDVQLESHQAAMGLVTALRRWRRTRVLRLRGRRVLFRRMCDHAEMSLMSCTFCYLHRRVRARKWRARKARKQVTKALWLLRVRAQRRAHYCICLHEASSYSAAHALASALTLLRLNVRRSQRQRYTKHLADTTYLAERLTKLSGWWFTLFRRARRRALRLRRFHLALNRKNASFLLHALDQHCGRSWACMQQLRAATIFAAESQLRKGMRRLRLRVQQRRRLRCAAAAAYGPGVIAQASEDVQGLRLTVKTLRELARRGIVHPFRPSRSPGPYVAVDASSVGSGLGGLQHVSQMPTAGTGLGTGLGGGTCVVQGGVDPSSLLLGLRTQGGLGSSDLRDLRSIEVEAPVYASLRRVFLIS